MNTSEATTSRVSPLRLGSKEHRHLLATFFVDTHAHYSPEHIAWPALDEEARTRLAALPFWQEAVETENVTSYTVAAAAALEADPEVRYAIELQGVEEHRHAQLLQQLADHYRIPISRPHPYAPARLEHDFLFAGFGECFDSFFAFGLFALARESGLFDPRLVAIFEPIVQEEARHILFFVNWVKYRRSQIPWWRRPLYRVRCGWIILEQIRSRISTARSLSKGEGASGENFTLQAHQDLSTDVTLSRLLQMCITENDRRLSLYDSRLVRPRLVPAMARFLRRILRMLPGSP